MLIYVLYLLKKAISQCAGKVIIIHAVTVLIGIYTRAIIYIYIPVHLGSVIVS